jgi:endoglucanase
MKKKCIATLLGALGLAVIAQGALIAYEGFDYTAGNLSGQAGGSGWAAAWDGASGTPAVSTPGMSYTGINNSGGKADIIATSGSNSMIGRTLNSSFTSGSGEVWFSFLAQKTGTSARFFNFSFFDGGTERLKIGHNSNPGTQTWYINDGGTPAATSVNTGVSYLNETLFVGKLTYDASVDSNDVLQLWVNPDLSLGESGLGSAFTSTSDWDFNRIRLGAGDAETGSSGIFDEIRFGTTFNDVITTPLDPSKLNEVKVVDRDYIMIHFIDNEVVFVDDGQGPSAFGSNKSDSSKNYVIEYGKLNTAAATTPANWVIKSTDDANYGTTGLHPVACSRKMKLNGAAQFGWNQTTRDWNYEYAFEHTIYLRLPHSLAQSKSYTLEILPAINSTETSQSFTYDIFNSRSEAIHLNLVGFLNDNSIKATDLHHWMGDGDARNYSSFVGNKVYIYDVHSGISEEVGSVKLFKVNDPSKEGHGRNLTGSDVWSADFTGFNRPGTYRIAIEGVGCSEDFEIKHDLYFEPFKISTLGFYYMRIGEDMSMTPVPRQPRYIPYVDPVDCRVYVTDMHPWHPDWGKVMDERFGSIHWDREDAWEPYIKAGYPENNNAWGGHSDALDWDRHLEHVSIIYDMLLPYLLTGGALPEDNLGIFESGNGIPDILDEARNEVDFWLRLRYNGGYSHGLTNPSENNVLYQADNTPLAAWANAVNASMLADCFRLAGLTSLKEQYTAAAEEAYNYASSLPDQWLDIRLNVGEGTFRGKDLKMTAAAFLYNLTGNTVYENMLNSLCDITSNTSIVCDKGDNGRNQLYACAAYLTTPRTVNYPTLHSRMKASVIHEAKIREANNIYIRASRRATDPSTEWFKTIQNVQRCIVGHAIADSQADRDLFLDAMVLEADWGLGRNSGNMIYMTTATTSLANKRSIQNAYTSGWNDGTPGVHPGHTPYMNIDDWAESGMIGNMPSRLAAMCYPDFVTHWPQDQSDFNNRFVWAHSEFTPQQTMRGKQALYGYLYALYNYEISPLYEAWAQASGLTGDNNAATDDPDNDGLINYVEFALNGNPLDASDRGALSLKLENGLFSIIHARRTDDPALIYTLLDTTNLVTGLYTTNRWSSQAVGPAGAANYETITNHYEMTDHDQLFIKLILE